MDVERIRALARESVEEGAVTAANTGDREKILILLESALATEWICVLRYSQHAATATGLHAEGVAKEFAQHAQEELDHAQRLAERIHQLGGKPSLEPRKLAEKAHSRYEECDNLLEMIRENLIAERIAIISYTEMVRFVGDSDPTTRRLLESILEVEEEHADELSAFLDALDVRDEIGHTHTQKRAS